MKVAFKIIGWIMFILLSYQLLIDFCGIDMFDTVLFSLNGKSVGLQDYREIIDIDPWVAGIIYCLSVSINVFSAFRKKDYIVVNMINLAFGVMLLIIYAPALKDYFPFGNVEWHIPAILYFILWAYSAIVIAIVEFILILLKRKLKQKQHGLNQLTRVI